MNPAYEVWIFGYLVTNNHFVRGKCVEACEAMQAKFPELTLTPGVVTYYGYDGKPRREQHMWLTAPDGERIDPTEAQFESGFGLTYLPVALDDADAVAKLVPIGTCPNCGESYTQAQAVGDMFCSDSCCDSYGRYLNNGGD